MNTVILIGNLGKDPEFKDGGNYKMAKFSLATSESTKDNTGEWRKTTDWHDIVVWGGMAEYASKHLKKGDRVGLQGKIQYREYEGKHYTSIMVNPFGGVLEKLSFDTEKKQETKKEDKFDWSNDMPF